MTHHDDDDWTPRPPMLGVVLLLWIALAQFGMGLFVGWLIWA